MKTFDQFFEWLMGWEGEVFEDDPDDPGGKTRYGIDQRSHPHENIKTLSRDRAKAIYKAEYWGAVKAEELPWPINWIVTDIAVNNGKGRAIKWLQEAVGATADGQLGPKTLAAVKTREPTFLRRTLLARREEFYRSIAKGAMSKYLKGWLNRNNSLFEETK